MLDIHQTQSFSPATRHRIDWREAAALLARGHTVGDVAARLDCPAAAIRRNLARSERFRNWISHEQAGLAELSRRRLATLMLKLPDAIEAAVEKGNATVLKWMAEHLVKGELGLITPLWEPVAPAGDNDEGDDLPGSIDPPVPEVLDAEADSAADEGEGEGDGIILPADRPLPNLHRQLLHLVDMPSTDRAIHPPRPPEPAAGMAALPPGTAP